MTQNGVGQRTFSQRVNGWIDLFTVYGVLELITNMTHEILISQLESSILSPYPWTSSSPVILFVKNNGLETDIIDHDRCT